MLRNYIIRIYRSERVSHSEQLNQDSVRIDGLVESIESGERYHFSSSDELWSIFTRTENERKEYHENSSN